MSIKESFRDFVDTLKLKLLFYKEKFMALVDKIKKEFK